MNEIQTVAQQIKCTECGSIEDAVIELTWPWATYVHTCTGCGYIIMESEWNPVNDNQQK